MLDSDVRTAQSSKDSNEKSKNIHNWSENHHETDANEEEGKHGDNFDPSLVEITFKVVIHAI